MRVWKTRERTGVHLKPRPIRKVAKPKDWTDGYEAGARVNARCREAAEFLDPHGTRYREFWR